VLQLREAFARHAEVEIRDRDSKGLFDRRDTRDNMNI
jgi:hypothetical protein